MVGVVLLRRAVTHAFTARQIELLKTFADQAVIAIENARLFEEVQARTRDLEESLAQQTATAEVLKVISRSAFDLEPALDNVCETAARLCNAERVAIFRREGDLYRFAASYGFPAEYESAWRAAGARAIDPASPLVGHRALAERRPCMVLDVTADPAFLGQHVPRRRHRTSLGVPLLREGEPVGNFVLSRKRVEAFSPRQHRAHPDLRRSGRHRDREARLIEEVQARTRDLDESLQQQTATADVLKVISRSAFDLDTVFADADRPRRSNLRRAIGNDLRRDGDVFRYRGDGRSGADGRLERYLRGHPLAARRAATDRRARDPSGEVEHIPDMLQRSGLSRADWRALGSPGALAARRAAAAARRRGEGVFVVPRAEPGRLSAAPSRDSCRPSPIRR